MDIQTIINSIHASAAVTPPLYRLPMGSKDAIRLLEESYLAIMRERGGNIGINEATTEIIAKTGKWLTNNIEHRKPSLMMCGNIGRGKTTLCSAIVRMVEQSKGAIATYSNANRWRLTAADKRMEWDWQCTTTPEMVTAKAISQADEREMDRLSRVAVLIIDDLGVEPVEVKNYGTTITPIIDVINDRYANMRCTIITTNLDEEGIVARYGDRTEDRLKEMCDRIAFEGESYRR